MVSDTLMNKSGVEKATLKGEALSHVSSVPRCLVPYPGTDFEIEIVKTEPTDGGVVVFARAWEQGNQIGFGKDGLIDIERFRIFNPPILVPTGIKRLVTEKLPSGRLNAYEVDTYREDPQAALLSVIAHTVKVKQERRENLAVAFGTIGNTTSTFYPQAGSGGGNTTCDGRVSRLSVNESFATIIAGDGTQATTAASSSNFLQVGASVTSNQYEAISRSIYTFNTAAIPDTDTVSSATFSVAMTAETDEMSGGASANSAIVVTNATPAADNTLATSDYGNIGSSEYGRSVTQENMTFVGYQDISISSSAVSKTGITKLGTRYGWDFAATTTGLTWVSQAFMSLTAYYADETGTTNDPKLTVEHAAVAAFTPKVIIF